MISKESYSLDWILEVRKRIGNRHDPKLIEKVIYALALLEQLREQGLDFIFKGGTSILLATGQPQRFSIDIDIVTDHSEAEIVMALNALLGKDSFKGWESDGDREHISGAPLGHFKLNYISAVDGKTEPILLDVLYSPNPYSATRSIPIDHLWLVQENDPLRVEIPTFEAILGDKLTAFAPETTGILYSKNRPLEIIKQLYDIAFLFDRMEDIEVVRSSFEAVVKEEIAFRKRAIEPFQVLEDIFHTSYLLVERNQTSDKFQHLLTGIRNITNFIIGRFTLNEAIIAGAKAAYLSSILRYPNFKEFKKYSGPEEIADWTIKDTEKAKLNKLKKSNPEAFFYWFLANQVNSD